MDALRTMRTVVQRTVVRLNETIHYELLHYANHLQILGN